MQLLLLLVVRYTWLFNTAFMRMVTLATCILFLGAIIINDPGRSGPNLGAFNQVRRRVPA